MHDIERFDNYIITEQAVSLMHPHKILLKCIYIYMYIYIYVLHRLTIFPHLRAYTRLTSYVLAA